MHRRALFLGAIGAAATSATAADGWQNRFAQQLRDDFLAHWLVEKQYSMAVLDAMPTDRFDLKPTPEQRTFAEQVAHFASANVNYFRAFELPVNPPTVPTEDSPQALHNYLAASYEYVAKVLGTISEEDFSRRDLEFGRAGQETLHTAQDVFMRAYMHSAHHRGSLVVYLRLAGVEPPRWRFMAQGLVQP